MVPALGCDDFLLDESHKPLALRQGQTQSRDVVKITGRVDHQHVDASARPLHPRLPQAQNPPPPSPPTGPNTRPSLTPSRSNTRPVIPCQHRTPKLSAVPPQSVDALPTPCQSPGALPRFCMLSPNSTAAYFRAVRDIVSKLDGAQGWAGAPNEDTLPLLGGTLPGTPGSG